MKRPAILLSATLMFAACTQERPPIAEAEMLPLVIDLHMADAYSTQVRDTVHASLDKNYDSLSVWTLRILDRHKISREAFRESMDWYRDHPDRLHDLYEAAADSLERMQK